MVYGLSVLLIEVLLVALIAQLLRRKFRHLEFPELFGASGLATLAFIGSWPMTLLFGRAGSPATVTLIVMFAVLGFTSREYNKGLSGFAVPTKRFLVGVALFGVALAIPILRALSPGDMTDWDTYAYHFAAPKIWLHDGAQTYLPFMHQSNFPGLVDNLFLYGLRFDESAARAFTVLYLLFGTCALYGWTARLFGRNAGWLAALACLGVPVMLWSGGTGYIDMPHGFFVGLGILYLVEGLVSSGVGVGAPVTPDSEASTSVGSEASRAAPVAQSGGYWKIALGVIFLFCGVASKYTGLMTAFFGALLILWSLWRSGSAPKRHVIKPALIGLVIGLAIACPWYIRNIQNTGNPVYPFFSSAIQTRNWDAFRAKIYAEEQDSFGVGKPGGKRDWSAIGHATLGLGYQPGRYANPNPGAGTGLPFWALGAAILLAPVGWLIYGFRGNRMVGMLLTFTGLTFLSWFVLTEQVRYLTAIVPVLSALMGMAVFGDATSRAASSGDAPAEPQIEEVRFSSIQPWKKLLFAATVAQALYTVWMLWEVQGKRHLTYLASGMSREAYLESQFPFAKPAKYLDSLSDGKSKTALYGEVFGYLMDSPYFWANPGHSTLINYDSMKSGTDYANTMRSLGFKTIYLNLADQPDDVRTAFLRLHVKASEGESADMPAELRERLDKDLRTRWLNLLYDAAQNGSLEFKKSFPEDLFRARSLVYVIR